MKRKTCTLYLSCEEYGVILDALIRFKNKLQDEASLHLNIVYIRKAV